MKIIPAIVASLTLLASAIPSAQACQVYIQAKSCWSGYTLNATVTNPYGVTTRYSGNNPLMFPCDDFANMQAPMQLYITAISPTYFSLLSIKSSYPQYSWQLTENNLVPQFDMLRLDFPNDFIPSRAGMENQNGCPGSVYLPQ